MTRSDFRVVRIALLLDEFSPEVRKMAAAITIAEMGFRGFSSRMAEYFVAMCMAILGRNVGFISVGVSQVSLRHTMRLYGCSPSKALLISSNPHGSIKTCCKILQSYSRLDVDHAILKYNGRASPFYRMKVKLALADIEALLTLRRAAVGAHEPPKT